MQQKLSFFIICLPLSSRREQNKIKTLLCVTWNKTPVEKRVVCSNRGSNFYNRIWHEISELIFEFNKNCYIYIYIYIYIERKCEWRRYGEREKVRKWEKSRKSWKKDGWLRSQKMKAFRQLWKRIIKKIKKQDNEWKEKNMRKGRKRNGSFV